LKDTPFRVVYGRDPPSLHAYSPVSYAIKLWDVTLQTVTNSFLMSVTVSFRLPNTKHYYDGKLRALSFDIGEWAWLHLQHRPAMFLGSGAK
jgi:hypothetical protein